MARQGRPPSSRGTKKRETWDMLRGWQVKSVPDEDDETGIYCWGKRKTDVDPYTNFDLWRKLYRGWDPFLCDITTKCTAIEDVSGFVDDSLDEHLRKDATRIPHKSSKTAVAHCRGTEDRSADVNAKAPDGTQGAAPGSQPIATAQVAENGKNGGDTKTRLFPNEEWAGTDSKKEVDEKTMLSVRCNARNGGPTPAIVTLDSTAIPDRHYDPGAHAHEVRQRYGFTAEPYYQSDDTRHMSYMSISKAYASVHDETESDNRTEYTRTAVDDVIPLKPVRLQYSRSNVAYIPEAYHNGKAAYGCTGFTQSSYASSQAMYACGKRCLNAHTGDANKPEDGYCQDAGYEIANDGGQWQNEPRHLVNGVSDPGGEHDDVPVTSNKHETLVLKKVTLQESSGDGDMAHPVASTPHRPVSAVKGAKCVHDKQRSDVPARVADQQNRESRLNPTKSGGSVVWPTGKHDQSYFSIRDLFPGVDKLNMRRSFPLRSSRPLGSVVIDDGSQRDTKFGSKERITDTTRSFTMREGIEHLRQKERLQMPGPPSFRPTKNRTPLHRAMEMTKKRMFGHWVPGGQASDDVDVPPKWQSVLGGSFSAPPDGGKPVNNGDESNLCNNTNRYAASYDTMGFGRDPGFGDTRSSRMQSVYESTLGSLYKLSRQRRHKLGWSHATAALLQTHTHLDYDLQGIARSTTAADKV